VQSADCDLSDVTKLVI